MRWHNHCGLLALIVSLGIAGCGESGVDTAAVTGKVVFEDGSPLTTGQVTFSNGIISATGAIQSDGTFTLGTNEPGDGAPAGNYKVTIVASEGGDLMFPEGDTDASVEPTATLVKDLIDPKFFSKETSGLTADVKDGDNQFEFKVSRP